MSSADDDRRIRYEQNVRVGRALAERLAEEAERIAVTLDRLADVHETLAMANYHPLKTEAMEWAVVERTIALRERQSSVWFRDIASGAYQSEPIGPPPRTPQMRQRLPSQ